MLFFVVGLIELVLPAFYVFFILNSPQSATFGPEDGHMGATQRVSNYGTQIAAAFYEMWISLVWAIQSIGTIISTIIGLWPLLFALLLLGTAGVIGQRYNAEIFEAYDEFHSQVLAPEVGERFVVPVVHSIQTVYNKVICSSNSIAFFFGDLWGGLFDIFAVCGMEFVYDLLDDVGALIVVVVQSLFRFAQAIIVSPTDPNATDFAWDQIIIKIQDILTVIENPLECACAAVTPVTTPVFIALGDENLAFAASGILNATLQFVLTTLRAFFDVLLYPLLGDPLQGFARPNYQPTRTRIVSGFQFAGRYIDSVASTAFNNWAEPILKEIPQLSNNNATLPKIGAVVTNLGNFVSEGLGIGLDALVHIDQLMSKTALYGNCAGQCARCASANQNTAGLWQDTECEYCFTSLVQAPPDTIALWPDFTGFANCSICLDTTPVVTRRDDIEPCRSCLEQPRITERSYTVCLNYTGVFIQGFALAQSIEAFGTQTRTFFDALAETTECSIAEMQSVMDSCAPECDPVVPSPECVQTACATNTTTARNWQTCVAEPNCATAIANTTSTCSACLTGFSGSPNRQTRPNVFSVCAPSQKVVLNELIEDAGELLDAIFCAIAYILRFFLRLARFNSDVGVEFITPTAPNNYTFEFVSYAVNYNFTPTYNDFDKIGECIGNGIGAIFNENLGDSFSQFWSTVRWTVETFIGFITQLPMLFEDRNIIDQLPYVNIFTSFENGGRSLGKSIQDISTSSSEGWKYCYPGGAKFPVFAPYQTGVDAANLYHYPDGDFEKVQPRLKFLCCIGETIGSTAELIGEVGNLGFEAAADIIDLFDSGFDSNEFRKDLRKTSNTINNEIVPTIRHFGDSLACAGGSLFSNIRCFTSCGVAANRSSLFTYNRGHYDFAATGATAGMFTSEQTGNKQEDCGDVYTLGQLMRQWLNTIWALVEILPDIFVVIIDFFFEAFSALEGNPNPTPYSTGTGPTPPPLKASVAIPAYNAKTTACEPENGGRNNPYCVTAQGSEARLLSTAIETILIPFVDIFVYFGDVASCVIDPQVGDFFFTLGGAIEDFIEFVGDAVVELFIASIEVAADIFTPSKIYELPGAIAAWIEDVAFVIFDIIDALFTAIFDSNFFQDLIYIAKKIISAIRDFFETVIADIVSVLCVFFRHWSRCSGNAGVGQYGSGRNCTADDKTAFQIACQETCSDSALALRKCAGNSTNTTCIDWLRNHPTFVTELTTLYTPSPTTATSPTPSPTPIPPDAISQQCSKCVDYYAPGFTYGSVEQVCFGQPLQVPNPTPSPDCNQYQLSVFYGACGHCVSAPNALDKCPGYKDAYQGAQSCAEAWDHIDDGQDSRSCYRCIDDRYKTNSAIVILDECFGVTVQPPDVQIMNFTATPVPYAVSVITSMGTIPTTLPNIQLNFQTIAYSGLSLSNVYACDCGGGTQCGNGGLRLAGYQLICNSYSDVGPGEVCATHYADGGTMVTETYTTTDGSTYTTMFALNETYYWTYVVEYGTLNERAFDGDTLFIVEVYSHSYVKDRNVATSDPVCINFKTGGPCTTTCTPTSKRRYVESPPSPPPPPRLPPPRRRIRSLAPTKDLTPDELWEACNELKQNATITNSTGSSRCEIALKHCDEYLLNEQYNILKAELHHCSLMLRSSKIVQQVTGDVNAVPFNYFMDGTYILNTLGMGFMFVPHFVQWSSQYYNDNPPPEKDAPHNAWVEYEQLSLESLDAMIDEAYEAEGLIETDRLTRLAAQMIVKSTHRWMQGELTIDNIRDGAMDFFTRRARLFRANRPKDTRSLPVRIYSLGLDAMSIVSRTIDILKRRDVGGKAYKAWNALSNYRRDLSIETVDFKPVARRFKRRMLGIERAHHVLSHGYRPRLGTDAYEHHAFITRPAINRTLSGSDQLDLLDNPYEILSRFPSGTSLREANGFGTNSLWEQFAGKEFCQDKYVSPSTSWKQITSNIDCAIVQKVVLPAVNDFGYCMNGAITDTLNVTTLPPPGSTRAPFEGLCGDRYVDRTPSNTPQINPDSDQYESVLWWAWRIGNLIPFGPCDGVAIAEALGNFVTNRNTTNTVQQCNADPNCAGSYTGGLIYWLDFLRTCNRREIFIQEEGVGLGLLSGLKLVLITWIVSVYIFSSILQVGSILTSLIVTLFGVLIICASYSVSPWCLIPSAPYPVPALPVSLVNDICDAVDIVATPCLPWEKIYPGLPLNGSCTCEINQVRRIGPPEFAVDPSFLSNYTGYYSTINNQSCAVDGRKFPPCEENDFDSVWATVVYWTEYYFPGLNNYARTTSWAPIAFLRFDENYVKALDTFTNITVPEDNTNATLATWSYCSALPTGGNLGIFLSVFLLSILLFIGFAFAIFSIWRSFLNLIVLSIHAIAAFFDDGIMN